MCGICGRLELDAERPAARHTVHGMSQRLAHRGPDDATLWESGPVAFGHRRLSIIDLDGGQQPISNEIGTVHVICNGEIYNFKELRARLIKRGHGFRTRSDTEVIVHAYEEWGTGLLEHIDGMFAFALWDGPRSRLFLARDRLGIKPLFYSSTPHRNLTFASEIKALLVDPEVPRELDLLAIDQYLSLQYVPAPRTGFVGIWKLPPAHGLVVTPDMGVRLWEYWDPSGVEPVTSKSRAIDAVQGTLSDAVRSHLVSDVPVGSFLSGGIDSGLITALMARAQAEPVRAITVGFGNSPLDERPDARAVATRYGCTHHERLLDVDVKNTFDQVVNHLDEPFADWSTLPTYLVSQVAREQVKVVLSGDGGDELFGGYWRHRLQRIENLARVVTDRLPTAFVRRSIDLYPRAFRGGRALRHLNCDHTVSVARKHAHGFFTETSEKKSLYGPAMLDSLPSGSARFEGFAEPFARYYDRVRDRDALTATLYVELKTYLVDDILTKVDRMSMAHSLEVRVPFLDHHVVELALSLRATWKVGWRRGKLILRDAFRPLLPRRHWAQPKRGFDIPASEWLCTELKDQAHDLLLGERARHRGLIDIRGVERLWTAHQQGHPGLERKLWALTMLEAWIQNTERYGTESAMAQV